MLALAVLTAWCQLCLALPSVHKRAEPGRLLILDTGVGHRSSPTPQWQTSLRSLSTSGTNASIIQEFGPSPGPGGEIVPIGATSLAYSPSTGFAFSATGEGIIRTHLSSGVSSTIIPTDQEGHLDSISSIALAPLEQKIYYATSYTGLIHKANLDGSSRQLVRNVSQGLAFGVDTPGYTPSNSYAAGLLVDEEKGFLYWSAVRGDTDGSIRRAALSPQPQPQPQNPSPPDQLLVPGIPSPGPLRLVRDPTTATNALWWLESARPSTAPASLKLLDISRLPPASSPASSPVPTTTMLLSTSHPAVFTAPDPAGAHTALDMAAFVVYRDGVTQRVWLVARSSKPAVLSRLVEVTWQGSGGGRREVLRVMNQSAGELGVPVGLEYVA
ncbi:hypothetical protein ACN47E_004165 [Coniothyrium glycines]